MKMLMRTALLTSVAVTGLACGSSGVRASQGQPDQKPSTTALLLGGLARSGFTGTVVVNDTAASSSDSNDSIGTTTTTRSLNNHVTFTVTPGRVVVKIAYEEKSRVDSELRYQYHKVVGYKTEETIASGTRQENASVTVDLRSGGMYQINFGSGGGVPGLYRMVDTAETVCTNLAADPTCRPGTSKSEDSGKPPGQGGVGGSVDGKLDAKTPNVLRGSTTQQHELNDGSTATRTVTWNLSR
jgi:hypothetical protein